VRTLGTVVATALALTFGGCTVTDGGTRNEQREAIQEVVGDGELTIDLSSPPTRADVALPDGRSTVILERDGEDLIDVTVVFRDGTELTTPARWVSVTAEDGEADPTSVTIRRAGDGLDDLRAAVEQSVAELGVEQSRADTALSQSEQATSGRSDVMYALPAAVAPPDKLTVRTIAKASREEYAVNYIVEWEAS
jgi:hypothetical protein